MEEIGERRVWPVRAVLFLMLGGLCGFLFQELTKSTQPWSWTDDPLKLGAAAFVAAGGIAFAFSLERARWLWSVAFALAVGLVVGSVTWRNGSWASWGSNEGWQLFSALLAVTIAVPLFQTGRDAGRVRLDYQALHAHSWTNAILWGAAWAFVLIVFLLAHLLGQLFDLIGLHLLDDLLGKRWFDWTLVGGVFGVGVALLRDRDRVLVMLQRVVTGIVSVLTPGLAFGLVLFLLALPFTGLSPLWHETKQSTPILLFCVLSAFVLVNATIGNSEDEEARAPVLRYAALALGTAMLPLGIVAAISTGKRVAQYGLTPDRLWAVTFVAIAIACGVAYLTTILRRRRAWAGGARRANIGLALGVCAIALFLALPIISFGAISAGNQLWRIRTGRVVPEKADWAALRFEFGPSGKRAVERLAATASDPRTRKLAARVLKADNRWKAALLTEQARDETLPHIVTVLPQMVPPPPDMVTLLFHEEEAGSTGLCASRGHCLVQWHPGDKVAIAMLDSCAPDPRYPREQPSPGSCAIAFSVLEETPQGWREAEEPPSGIGGFPSNKEEQRQMQALRAAALAGKVELRTIQVRQLFVDGRPQGSILR